MRSKPTDAIGEPSTLRQSPRSKKTLAQASPASIQEVDKPEKRAAESELEGVVSKKNKSALSGRKRSPENKVKSEGRASQEKILKAKERTESIVNRDQSANHEPKTGTECQETRIKHSPKKAASKKAVTKVEVSSEEDETESKKPKRRRKTKEEKEAEAMPLAARTKGLKMFVGAHVSGAKGRNSFSTQFDSVKSVYHLGKFLADVNIGVQNSVTNCDHIG